ncbi:MAG: HlyD family efflux transporter periplasmic adaptor subunit [Cyclobacteriaceae bacterium]
MKSIVKVFLISLLFISCNDNANNFDASGTFEAVEVIVSSEVSGTIEQLDVEEGSSVEKGQLLGWIDSTQLYLKKKQLRAQIDAILSKRPHIATQLASYRVQLDAAEREQQRVRNLFKAEAATQKQVDDATAQVGVIRRQMEAHRSSLDISSQGLISETLPISAQIEQLEDQLQQSRIVNPLGGTILARYAETHELAVPGKPLYKVADISTLELRAYITGTQIPLVKLNQKVTVFADNGSGGYNEYPGTLTWISSKAEFTPKTIQTKEERADLVYAIKVRVKNNGFLKIGMYGELKF